jgi:hypothetical protein
MFFYSVAPDEGKGFSFWIDELKFEKLGTLAHGQFAIMGGQNQTETSFAGRTRTIGGSTAIINLPTGVNQTLGIAISYFEFSSSDKSIATVNEDGEVSVIGGPGMAVITAEVNGVEASGSLTIQSLGDFPHAPTPTHPAENVISIFSDAYSNHPVDYYNGYWEPWQTTQSADFVENGDHFLHYTDFNFVGIQFGSPPVDATTMTHFSMDIYIPHTLSSNAQFKIGLVDNSGLRGNFTRTITPEESQQWISLDIPLNSFAGLTTRTAIWQIIFEDVNENIPGFWADNIYFRK